MFLDMVLRSLARQKTRSFLTGMGVFLAIATIVSLGSFSEGINSLVEEQLKFAGNLIQVTEKTEGGVDFSGPPAVGSKVPREILDEIKSIEGVDDAVGMIMQVDVETQLFVVGVPLEDTEFFELKNIEFSEGGWPEIGEKAIAVGNQVSELQGLKVGDNIKLNGEEYVVSGVLEKLNNFIDYGILSSVDAIGETFDMEDYYSGINVEPDDVADSDRIANEIMDSFDYLEASTAEENARRAQDAINQVRVFTLGIGVIASLVSSIGIINTMIIIVFERRREFGIMKALGGQRKVILMLVVQEAALIGIMGSLLGIAVGYAGSDALNSMSSFPIAKVTPQLAIMSLIYGVLLSVFAALYPAYTATKVDPVEAMRQQ
jgi:putative ABC transport system permease protein